MHVGERIKKLRLEKKMKQADLAEKAKVSRVAIGNYERCERQPTIDIVGKIAKALDVSITDLMPDEKLAKESQEYEGFITYLESLGYIIKAEPDEIISSSEQDEFDKNGILVGKSTVIKEATYIWTLFLNGKELATFTKDEFDGFQAAIKDAVEVHIWKKNKEK